ncbi:hypothetical protein IMCC3317_46990 [Kordia antarctica]|uniref:DUF481 domain-containing protein n=1 Tax=Kordia antarctica TaxID=1218801 RepID=A0A7L4ZSB4_9FLAO|nr:DUF481 domain-containing protein [Kordia antarctica]QHI39289.1 hypothetical protein IMCC3317_46990 [Kordia antarctica]
MNLKHVIFLAVVFIFPLLSYTQNDTIVANNDNIIIGEIKEMNKGVLKIETSYSNRDFSIEWLEIKRIYSETEFLISTTNGNRYNENLRILNPKEVIIFSQKGTLANVSLKDIVFLKTIKSKFWDRISAAVSLGYNFTKSNNFRQFSLRSNLGYQSKNWSIYASYNGIASNRNDAETVKRTDASLSYRYFLRNDWFPLAEVNWLSNTEQNIKLRTVSKLGIGKFIKRTNALHWGIQVGASYNNESFTDATISSQNSLEGFIGSELNLYDVGDISLLTKVIAYPGITESGRLRLDAMLDVQYDLPLDFFIKLGFTVNYDNESVVLGSKYDYIFQTSFDWKL